GVLTITGAMTWTSGGSVAGYQTSMLQVTIASGATLNVNGPFGMTLDNSILKIQNGATARLNAGTLTCSGNSTIIHSGDLLFQGGTLVLQNGSTVLMIVTNLGDGNSGSLRWAINQANASPVDQIIQFTGLSGTIYLTQALPDLDNNPLDQGAP